MTADYSILEKLMRQRNVHGFPLTVPVLGRVVHDGEEVEFDELLAGFEPVPDERGTRAHMPLDGDESQSAPRHAETVIVATSEHEA